jgi:hypothetical protein
MIPWGFDLCAGSIVTTMSPSSAVPKVRWSRFALRMWVGWFARYTVLLGYSRGHMCASGQSRITFSRTVPLGASRND